MPKPVEYWDIPRVAAEAGMQRKTIVKYYSSGDGIMPTPDIVLNGQPGWLPQTIAAFWASRPGRGHYERTPKERTVTTATPTKSIEERAHAAYYRASKRDGGTWEQPTSGASREPFFDFHMMRRD